MASRLVMEEAGGIIDEVGAGPRPEASILIIDDQETSLRFLERALRQAGYDRIHVTTDPRLALAGFAEFAPDLVLLNPCMLAMDGSELVARLRLLVPPGVYLPLLLITAAISPRARREVIAAGAHDFLSAPLDATEVVLRVGNLLETGRLHGALRQREADLEAEVQRRAARLLQSEKLAMIGDLLGGIAHELNNPLAIVVANAQMMTQSLPAGPLRARGSKVEAAALRCARLIKDFLAAARQRPLETAAVDVNQIVREAAGPAADLLRAGNGELSLVLQSGLPAIRGDRHQLRQVVVSLIDNARWAVTDWEGERRVTVCTRLTAGGWVSLAVTDTGRGIALEIQQRVFDPFFTTKPVGDGPGLGLSLCQGIVSAHGGRMHLVSAAGAGARLIVELPGGDDARAAAPSRPGRVGGGTAQSLDGAIAALAGVPSCAAP